MAINSKIKLANKEIVTMINPNYPAPKLVAAVGGMGFDAVFVDCEHGPHSMETVGNFSLAAKAAGINTIVRPDSEAPHTITRYLDQGMDGVMVPHVDTKAAAEEVVQTIRYCRHSKFNDTLVICMIESVTAVENIDAILEVEDIDVFFVGPGDMSGSMGLHGQMKHPDVLEKCDYAFSKINEAGRCSGTLADYENTPDLIKKGVTFLYLHVNHLLAKGARDFHSLVPK